jgi:hypothetical protein
VAALAQSRQHRFTRAQRHLALAAHPAEKDADSSFLHDLVSEKKNARTPTWIPTLRARGAGGNFST